MHKSVWITFCLIGLLGCGRAGYSDELDPEDYDDSLVSGQGVSQDPLTGQAAGPCDGIPAADAQIEIDDSCLSYSSNSLSFWGAQRECLDQGGRLWTPDGDKEAAIRAMTSDELWTGAHYYTASNPKGWYTVTGERVSFSPWAANEPNNETGDAAVSTAEGTWITANRANGAYAFVCEFSPWTRIGDREYMSALDAGTSQAAQSRCIASGGALASLDDPLAYAELSAKLRTAMWLDIREDEDSGEHRWGNAVAIDSDQWDVNHPVMGQSCGQLSRTSVLRSSSCLTSAAGFVCQRPAR